MAPILAIALLIFTLSSPHAHGAQWEKHVLTDPFIQEEVTLFTVGGRVLQGPEGPNTLALRRTANKSELFWQTSIPYICEHRIEIIFDDGDVSEPPTLLSQDRKAIGFYNDLRLLSQLEESSELRVKLTDQCGNVLVVAFPSGIGKVYHEFERLGEGWQIDRNGYIVRKGNLSSLKLRRIRSGELDLVIEIDIPSIQGKNTKWLSLPEYADVRINGQDHRLPAHIASKLEIKNVGTVVTQFLATGTVAITKGETPVSDLLAKLKQAKEVVIIYNDQTFTIDLPEPDLFLSIP